mmetsp:Transcript_19903/g.32748  ORF Transcript_19903/g.32748 Transcript_19903/m.32748 type:complete len:378 (-) Transcript_19903:48-1181(-)
MLSLHGNRAILAARNVVGKSRACAAVSARAFSNDVTPADPNSLDYTSMGFNYTPTKSICLYEYEEGKGWDSGKLTGPMLELHAMSNVLHYGQAVFEGLKCFHTKDGSVNAFNPVANMDRLNYGADRLGMPEVPQEIFFDAVDRCVKDNIDYVPPYGSGGSFYLRPFLFGHGAKLGLGVAPKFMFGVLGCPVGNYYTSGKIEPVNALVIDYDRAAPRGVGSVKCAGNYAADVRPAREAAAKGYPIALYLDAAERKYIEEFSTSNLVGISKDKKKYISPDSPSILRSNTNFMLRQIAADMGMTVEHRPVEYEELKTFSEVGACGTAVILAPVGSITRGEETINFDSETPVLTKLYETLRGIQLGEVADPHSWNHMICKK